jgi:hypothetical protein
MSQEKRECKTPEEIIFDCMKAALSQQVTKTACKANGLQYIC